MADSTHRAVAPTGVAILSDAPLGGLSLDYFGFSVYAEAIASLIDNDLTETPLTMAVSAPWGGGKTSVARMVRQRLDERTASRRNNRPVLACWFDAWMHVDAEHLGAALAGAVARTADHARPRWRRMLNPVPAAMLGPQERWRRRMTIALLAALLAALVVLVGPWSDNAAELLGIEHAAGLGALGPLLTSALLAVGVARLAFRAADDAARFIDDPRSEAARGSMAQVREQLGRLIRQARRGGRLVIYVDDLERCTPERALEVCEVASQLLSHEGVVTLLLADMDTIAAAADAHYLAQDGDHRGTGRAFLEKIVQVQVALPPPHRDHIRRLLRGDPPAKVFAGSLVPTVAPAVGGGRVADSLFGSVAQSIDAAVPWILSAFGIAGALMVAAIDSSSMNAPLFVALTLPAALLLLIRGSLLRRASQVRAEEESIRETIRAAIADQLPHSEVERRVLERTAPRYVNLAVDLLESSEARQRARVAGRRRDHPGVSAGAAPQREADAQPRPAVDPDRPRPRDLRRRAATRARASRRMDRARGALAAHRKADSRRAASPWPSWSRPAITKPSRRRCGSAGCNRRASSTTSSVSVHPSRSWVTWSRASCISSRRFSPGQATRRFSGCIAARSRGASRRIASHTPARTASQPSRRLLPPPRRPRRCPCGRWGGTARS